MDYSKASKENAQKVIEQHQLIVRRFEFAEAYAPENLNELICQRYIADQNVKRVADTLNAEGFRVEGRKYIGKDISNIILESTGPLSKEARAFFEFNNTVKNGTRSFSKLIKALQGCEDS